MTCACSTLARRQSEAVHDFYCDPAANKVFLRFHSARPRGRLRCGSRNPLFSLVRSESMDSLSVADQPVSLAADGENASRGVAVVAEFFPQPGDRHIEGARITAFLEHVASHRFAGDQ